MRFINKKNLCIISGSSSMIFPLIYSLIYVVIIGAILCIAFFVGRKNYRAVKILLLGIGLLIVVLLIFPWILSRLLSGPIIIN